MIIHFRLSQNFGRLCFLLLSFYASMNSFLVIIFVTPYRKITINLLMRFAYYIFPLKAFKSKNKTIVQKVINIKTTNLKVSINQYTI